MSLTRLAALMIFLTLLAACSVNPRAVVKREPGATSTQPRSRPAPTHGTAVPRHVVVRGDTLYGIAFRHGLDYRDLARWNAIAPPYTIYPGQELRLAAGLTATAASAKPSASAPPSAPATTAAVPARPATSAAATVTAPTASPAGSSASTPGAGTAGASAPAASATPPRSASAPAAPVTATTSSGSVAWRWPTQGQVIEKYVAGEPTKQGINIAGSSGQAVNAAAAGEVVYSGAGLIGYGELIIIRHSDAYLSAYGHNRKRLVAEGNTVQAGQQIAEMGRSGASRDMLHFEIRRNGKPIDPLPLLPGR